jgi:hypothetical protein
VDLDDSWRSYAKNDITTELKSGGGAILLHTATIPTGTITGTVTVLDADDGRTMTVVQDTVTTVAHGGTGASTVAGAKVNLEIPTVVDVLNSSSTADALSANKGKELNDNITTLNTHIANLNTGLNSLQYLKYSVYRDDNNGTSYSFTTKNTTGVGILVGFDEVWAFSYATGSGGIIGAKQIARAMRNQGDRGFTFAYNDSTKVVTVTTSSTVWGGIAVFYV